MDLDAKFDEDFIFYFGFANSYLQKITCEETKEKCQQWLQKLCGGVYDGYEMKRCRNIYLAELLLCMQNNKLEGPFLKSPADVDIADAFDVFERIPDELKVPDWLRDSDFVPDENIKNEKGGRTYVATRTLPGGDGAFAYVAISMGDEEPRWLGGRQMAAEEILGRRFPEYCPPPHEIEKIFVHRDDHEKRTKVLTFYEILLQNIADEIEEKVPAESNETVNGLMDQLVEDLRKKGDYGKYETMVDSLRKKQLLLILYKRVNARLKKIENRMIFLDQIEDKVLNPSFWDGSYLDESGPEHLPKDVWTQVINKLPPKKYISKMQEMYPWPVIQKFLELLSAEKERIASLVHQRHEVIIAQMKKELKIEGDKGRIWLEEAKVAYEQAKRILDDVREYSNKKLEREKLNREKTALPESEHSKLYDEMRDALLETYKTCEEEAARGRFLAAQINAVEEQTNLITQVNDDSIRKAEETNMAIMKNIKRLQAAIKIYDTRIAQIKNMTKSSKKEGKKNLFIY